MSDTTETPTGAEPTDTGSGASMPTPIDTSDESEPIDPPTNTGGGGS